MSSQTTAMHPATATAAMATAMASGSATGTAPVITKAAIDAACAKYEQNCFEHQDDELDDDDADEMPLEDIVVGRNVTRGDLDRIPDEWLDGVQLALLPDGTLVVDRLLSQEYSRASIAVTGAVRDYARGSQGHGLRTEKVEFNCGRFGLRTPEVVLNLVRDPLRTPRVIVDVCIDDDPSCRKTFEVVAAYFRNLDSVVRVVVFKFFSPRNPACMDGLVEVPALAMAFALTDPQDRASVIRVTEIESFGNVAISYGVVNSVVLGTGLAYFERLDRATEARLRQPSSQSVIVTTSPQPGLDSFRQLHENNSRATFSVWMPDPLVPMTFELVTLFEQAIEGRCRDEADCRAVEAARAQAGQGPTPAIRLRRSAGVSGDLFACVSRSSTSPHN